MRTRLIGRTLGATSLQTDSLFPNYSWKNAS